jgi:hypothetical protein
MSFTPAAANAALILGGVSPLEIVKAMSPLFMSYPVIRPYGGFSSRRPLICGTVLVAWLYSAESPSVGL